MVKRAQNEPYIEDDIRKEMSLFVGILEDFKLDKNKFNRYSDL